MYVIKYFCEISKGTFETSHTILNPYTSKHACYEVLKFEGTTRGQKAFSYSGARIWNLILSHIETDCAIGTFKKLFAKLLLNSKEDLLSIWIWINVVIPPH